MIELHSSPTPNGQKVMIMLEETGLPWKHFDINIRLGEQFTPDFLKLSPNNKIPGIVDTEGPGGGQCDVENYSYSGWGSYLRSRYGTFGVSGGVYGKFAEGGRYECYGHPFLGAPVKIRPAPTVGFVSLASDANTGSPGCSSLSLE